MMSGFIVKKGRMTNVYTPEGVYVAVTACHFQPLTVTQIKTDEKDGYAAVQVSYEKGKKEFKLVGENMPKVGDKIEINSVFEPNQAITVTGTSKGRGFAGVIKRYGFQRQPVSGGQSDRVRAPGAIGAQTPGKVLKGKKMPGHYGNKVKTISGLKVFAINSDKNEILITGSVPGHINSWVVINKSN